MIQCHAVELDGLGVLAQLEVDVAHVDAEAAGVVEHAVLRDDLDEEGQAVNIPNGCKPLSLAHMEVSDDRFLISIT